MEVPVFHEAVLEATSNEQLIGAIADYNGRIRGVRSYRATTAALKALRNGLAPTLLDAPIDTDTVAPESGADEVLAQLLNSTLGQAQSPPLQWGPMPACPATVGCISAEPQFEDAFNLDSTRPVRLFVDQATGETALLQKLRCPGDRVSPSTGLWRAAHHYNNAELPKGIIADLHVNPKVPRVPRGIIQIVPLTTHVLEATHPIRLARTVLPADEHMLHEALIRRELVLDEQPDAFRTAPIEAFDSFVQAATTTHDGAEVGARRVQWISDTIAL